MTSTSGVLENLCLKNFDKIPQGHTYPENIAQSIDASCIPSLMSKARKLPVTVASGLLFINLEFIWPIMNSAKRSTIKNFQFGVFCTRVHRLLFVPLFITIQSRAACTRSHLQCIASVGEVHIPVTTFSKFFWRDHGRSLISTLCSLGHLKNAAYERFVIKQFCIAIKLL